MIYISFEKCKNDLNAERVSSECLYVEETGVREILPIILSSLVFKMSRYSPLSFKGLTAITIF